MTRADDRASELEEFQRESALAAHRNRPQQPISDGLCVDCAEAIDPRRLAIQPNAIRCTEHQRDYERRHKTHFGRG